MIAAGMPQEKILEIFYPETTAEMPTLGADNGLKLYDMIDLDYNGTTNEYMHTVTGVGVKANQGWNASVWAIWNELIKRGKATDAYFKAADAKIASIE